MEFHVSREARDRYEFDQTLFAFSGNVVFANLGASREFAFRMNKRAECRKRSLQNDQSWRALCHGSDRRDEPPAGRLLSPSP